MTTPAPQQVPPVLTITGQLDLSWRDDWEHEARGDHGEWVSMTRGVYLGTDPAKLKAARADPVAFLRKSDMGRHWTADPDVSRQYAMGSDEDKRPGMFGVIVHGAAHHTSILPPGHPAIDAGVWQGEDSAEQEYPLKKGAQVNVSHVTVAWRDAQGNPHTETSPVQNAIEAANPQPAPAPPPQQVPPGQQPYPPQPLTPAVEAALVTAIAGLLLTAVSVAAVLEALKLRFTLSRALWSGLEGALGVAMSQPPPVTGVVGPASAQTSRQNLARRAQFVLSAGRRLAADAAQARAQGKPVSAALLDGLARERRYYGLHVAAMWQRATAAGKTDMAALEHGRLLGWYTVIDGKTSAECRAADGKNFYADAMPDINFPGATHPHCRCFPGPAHPGAPLLPSRGRARRTVGLAS